MFGGVSDKGMKSLQRKPYHYHLALKASRAGILIAMSVELLFRCCLFCQADGISRHPM